MAKAMNAGQFSDNLSKEHFYRKGVECAPDSFGLRYHCRASLTSAYK
jgi:hypothetical protein